MARRARSWPAPEHVATVTDRPAIDLWFEATHRNGSHEHESGLGTNDHVAHE